MTKHDGSAALGERLKHEVYEYIVLVLYLFVCFGAVVLYKAAILGGVGISYLPLGFAAVKALVLGKFVLLGQAFGLGAGQKHRRVATVIAYRAVLFVCLLVVMTMIEEAAIAFAHGEGAGASLGTHLGTKMPETLATCLIMLLILIPYIAFREVDRAIGEGTLGKALFHRRTGHEASR